MDFVCKSNYFLKSSILGDGFCLLSIEYFRLLSELKNSACYKRNKKNLKNQFKLKQEVFCFIPNFDSIIKFVSGVFKWFFTHLFEGIVASLFTRKQV